MYYPEVPMLTSANNKQIAEGQAESKTTALQPSTTQSSELDHFSNEINSVNQPRVLRATSLPSFHPSMDTIANDQVRSLRLMFQRQEKFLFKICPGRVLFSDQPFWSRRPRKAHYRKGQCMMQR